MEKLNAFVAFVNAAASAAVVASIVSRKKCDLEAFGIGLLCGVLIGFGFYFLLPQSLISFIGIAYLMLFTGIVLSLFACAAYRGAGVIEFLIRNIRNRKE